ncbi:hypothetical protein BGW80DRAFT_1458044 [Lactifluus volemus]|nr:hypothetical protein BGW80DRAFT_1458044 [Lactifluus volemus]
MHRVDPIFIITLRFNLQVPFPPAKAVFVGIDVLLQAASSVSASYDALVQIFDRVGNFLKRLQIYAKIPFTPPMIDIIVQIMLEILSVLALTTTEIKQGRFKKFKLAQLIEEETRMAAALTLQGVLESNTKAEINDKRTSTKDILSWLSPPDPSKNHIIARDIVTTGQPSAGSGKSVLCSMIVEATKAISDAESSLTAYYYFDFRDTAKQDIRGLLTSLLTQLSTKSDRCGSILSHLYSRHDSGSQQPGNDDLKQCLVEMLQLHDSPTIYIIVDALDECPNTSGVEPLVHRS